MEAGNGDRVAIHWEGERVGEDRTLTYSDLQAEVCKAANALSGLGLVAGDRVAIYMPMIPEAVVAMLACARLGVHAQRGVRGVHRHRAARPNRRRPSQTADHRRRAVPPRQAGAAEGGGRRSGRTDDSSPIEHVLVVRRTGIDVPWTQGRDVWWHDVVDLGVARAQRRGVRRRAPAVPAVHLGHHRQAQGHRAHQRRLSDPGVLHPPQRLRHQAGNRRVLVHRRYRLGHRAHLRRLRPAVQRRDPGSLRGHAKTRPTSTGISRSSKSTA